MAGTTPRLTLAAALLAAAPAWAETLAFGGAQPSLRWAQAVGEEDRAVDEVDGIAIDPSGNTVVTGVFRDAIEFGGDTLQSFGEGDVFLASIAPSGALNWARQFGGPGDDNAFDIAVDASGGIVISGWFSGTVDFGGTQVSSQGSQDMFLAKYAPTGGLVWVRRFGGAAGDGGNEVAVSADGEIAVAMLSEGGTAIEGRTYPDGGGGRDSFLLRVSADGELRWVLPFTESGTERIRAVGINEDGEVFTGLQFRGATAAAGQSFASAGDWDGLLVKVDAGGRATWALPVAGAGEDNVRGLAAAPDGAVYAGGIVGGAASLLGVEVPAAGRRGDDYLARVSPAGEVEWIVSLAGPGRSRNGPEVRADARGVVASSSLEGLATLRLNRRTLAEVSPPGGMPTSYLAAFTPQGEPRFLWLPQPTGRGSGATGDVLALSRDGRFLAQALRFRGELDADGQRMTTPADRDSAVVLLDLNGG